MKGAWRLLPLMRSTLQRRRVRLVFTLASIAVAFLLFGLLGAVRNALTAGVEVAGRDRLITTQKVSIIQPLPRAYLGRVRQVSGVEDAASLSWFGGIYQDPTRQLVVFAVDPNYFDLYAKELLVEPATLERWRADRIGIIGISSGGHQGMLGAMRPNDPRYAAIPLAKGGPQSASVNCVVMMWPVIDPLGRYRTAKAAVAKGGNYPERFKRVCPRI